MEPERPNPNTTGAINLAGENVHWDLRGSMSYADYLKLKPLLSCQTPLTKEHDELLFIVIHQASELWIKLSIHRAIGLDPVKFEAG